MNSPAKILLIDNTADRKERIRALKERGYGVFPALRMAEARSRCMRGGYDLIIVTAGEEAEQALQFADDLRHQCPKQMLLVRGEGDIQRDYAVGGDLTSLLNKVDELLRSGAKSPDYASAA